MSALILHQYALSPFSEKIRAMLGYTGIPWQAVTVREMPPRPHLETLTGGYRKIPVAQSGADIFCDTRIVSAELAQVSGLPALDATRASDEVAVFVREADLELFLAALIGSSGPGMLGKLIRETSVLDAFRFLKDRINMGRKARVPSMTPKQARQRLADHLTSLENRLSQHHYVFGPQACIADFSAYHSLWYARDLAGKSLASRYPRVDEWMNRLQAYGHGDQQPLSIDSALAEARNNTPRPLPTGESHEHLGQSVRIAPDDYARDPVIGELVAVTESRWILKREHDDVGTVHVHLPRDGFRLKPEQ
ncbi:glutathione S-transferase [Tamilnaduibacter salinus]|uniref:Glutathione S-transferase n=1 Tax=Tamilnaduibacter salinus TaxID=1484056 RepID=A0A2U1D137_9GAMM|nr:glutathione S-transferase family protein [Tamilnaduibacter salinus]PVY79106.1 glutathione S-transferase [Tamilnaduibacter salinus]